MNQAVPGRRAARPLLVALALLTLQLVYRGWIAFGSGWIGDDFVMMDRTYSPGGHTLSGLLASYAGHVVPAPLYLTWLITQASPYNYGLAAAAMMAMQLLAGLGMLRFLVVGFGIRWGILAPYALFLGSPFMVQATVWWCVGSQQFILQASLALAMASQIIYLRTGRRRSAVAAVLWVVLGLIFYEKTLLVIGALAFLTVAYFTEGTTGQRLVQVWQRYRFSVLLNGTLGVAYLALYVHYGMTFSPSGAAHHPLGPVADVMVLRSWATGIFGGPITWRNDGSGPVSFAHPHGLLVVSCLVLLGLLVRELVRTRRRSLRALWLPAYFLICDVLLVGAGRASLIGPEIGYEFRYLTELSVATAAALALATMPLIGAREPVEVTREGALDRPRFVVAACVLVSLAAVWSTTVYVHYWDRGRQASTRWTDNLLGDARDLPRGAHVVDAVAPEYVAWPISRPANLVSHLVRPLRDDLDYSGVSETHLRMVDDDGHIVPATLTRLRWLRPSRNHECGYRVGDESARLPLNDQVQFPGTWVRIGYLATDDSAVTVTVGGATYRTSVRSGIHELYVKAGADPFTSISIGGLVGPARLCTDDVVVGQPVSAEKG